VPGSFKHRKRTCRIDVMTLTWISDRATHTLNGKMEYLVTILDGFSNPRRIENGTRDHAHVAVRVRLGQVFGLAGRKIVEDRNFLSSVHQAIHQVAADEPSAARDQDSLTHRAFFRKPVTLFKLRFNIF